MHPDAMKEQLQQVQEAIDGGEDPDAAMDRILPRLFYIGHTVIHTFMHPNRKARWECTECKHQWVSEEGARCPECENCKHIWEWVAEEYGKRECRECEFPFEDTFKSLEAYEAWMEDSRKSRERNFRLGGIEDE